jgi:hypothetical protein
MPRRLALAVAATIAALVFALPGGARSKQNVLTGVVGPGFNISLVDESGQRVTHLDPGTYTINVQDKSPEHNFHLTGPGNVDQATDIDFVGNVTWTVALVDGTYRFQCDAHPTLMLGTFGAGSAPPPPAPPPPPPPPPKPKKLTASVGPGARISLRTASGAAVTRLTAGRYAVTVKDASKRDNFHLVGKGVNVKTGIPFTGKRVWTLRFSKGKYAYRSDATPRLKHSFSVS